MSRAVEADIRPPVHSLEVCNDCLQSYWNRLDIMVAGRTVTSLAKGKVYDKSGQEIIVILKD